MTSPPRRQQDDDFERLLGRAHRGPTAERTGCPDAATIAAYVEHSLDEEERARFEHHAADCAPCAEALALLGGLDEEAHAAPAVPTAPRWTWWRWLVPVATAVLVLIVWRELPQREVDTVVSDTRSPAATFTAPAAPPAAPVPPPQPEAPQVQPQQPLLKESVPDLRRNTTTAESQRQREALPQRKAAPPPAGAQVQRFEAPAARDEAVAGGAVGGSAPAAPAAETELRLRESVRVDTAISPQVKSPDGEAMYQVVAGGTVQRSSDGGHTWIAEPAPNVSGLSVGSAPARDVCWFAGAAGTVLRRSSAGTWQLAPLPQPLDIAAIAATSETTAVVTTTDGSRWQTTDGGMHWMKMQTP